MPCTSSCSAAVTTSSTERLCPRWITSAPMPCRMRRMMLIAASCPSNRLAAVTKRTLFAGRYSASALYSAERSVTVALLAVSGVSKGDASSDHAQVREVGAARRIAQLELEQLGLHGGRDHQVAMRLGIGRHDGPRRPGRACCGNRITVG